MTQSNGHAVHFQPASEEALVNDIKEMAAKIRQPLTVLEKVRDPDASFEQKSHTLMLESVDKITSAWVDELVSLRDNSKVIEEMVKEQADKVKGEMTRLHLLGVQAMREAQRGHEVLQNLGNELDAMMAGHAKTH
ncbi:hypothetical protein KIP88_03140 [Bradyrhizobium sp. SRL28]|uniref:hypothetical protein n=1 Tax=Bradyrhizobium sp. SRL28 TaxID=2836178 RepID=UPI001BDEE52F|nr:hypothetical protein [Bradyrhizobium sp. SRL28]MBT1509488.1 hypothetical protein [Bradyrhizobium sp. SRL28]